VPPQQTPTPEHGEPADGQTNWAETVARRKERAMVMTCIFLTLTDRTVGSADMSNCFGVAETIFYTVLNNDYIHFYGAPESEMPKLRFEVMQWHAGKVSRERVISVGV
jgi:hypothetical protein